MPMVYSCEDEVGREIKMSVGAHEQTVLLLSLSPSITHRSW